nr:hypothetical protein Iba_chr02fCG8390 [Ipomoea batatas]
MDSAELLVLHDGAADLLLLVLQLLLRNMSKLRAGTDKKGGSLSPASGLEKRGGGRRRPSSQPPHRRQPLPSSQHRQPHRLLPLLSEGELEVAVVVHRREELLPRLICCCQAPHSSKEGEDEGCYTPTPEVAFHYIAEVLAAGAVRRRGRKGPTRSAVSLEIVVAAGHRLCCSSSSLLVTATSAVDGKKSGEAEGGEKKVKVRCSGESDRDRGSWWPVVASMRERDVKGAGGLGDLNEAFFT